MLCAPLRSENSLVKQADLIELRADCFELKKFCQKPVIFKQEVVDFEALSILPEYVDLPHTTSSADFEKIKRQFPNVKTICSFHDFEKTGDLEKIYAELKTNGADLIKIATQANSTLDALRMLLLVKKYQCIGVCMGDLGAITRILAPVVGAPWTYAPEEESQKTAPGQILLQELVETFNYQNLNKNTRLYGLIGDPVSKSISHKTHNWFFKNSSLNAVYVKMCVKKEELPEFFSLCREVGFKGLSVTMPLKEAVIDYLDYPTAKAINTIGFEEEGVYGWNTDGSGALDALEKKVKVQGKKMVLLGAGGAAYGIAHEAKKRGAKLIICNRTLKRAEALASEVSGLAYPLSAFSQIGDYDILINCTSVGMLEPKSPVPEDTLLEGKVVMDIISSPRITPLLAAALKKNCEIIEGLQMFIHQALGQYFHWFKSENLALSEQCLPEEI